MSGFFTRPDLDDKQFRQLSGSLLTLSGETNFAGILKSKGVEIDASINTASIGDVLTWNGSKIVLSENASGGTGGIYTGLTPSNIAVGGMPIGSTLTGKTYTEILQKILITTYYPTLTAPDNTISFVAPVPSSIIEVGTTIPTINVRGNFNRGSISPQYTASSPFRSGLPNTYTYTGAQIAGSYPNTSIPDSNRTVSGYVVLLGSNSWSGNVSYDAGVQPKDSDGNNFSSPLAAGTTGNKSTSFTGIYPYFYGKVPSANPRPTAGQTLLNSGTKVVANSTGTVNVTYNTTGAEYVWVAIPSTSTLKTKWYVTALSNGTIGGVYPSGNKFPNPDVVSVNSPSALWSGVNYRFYISEIAGVETNIEFRNS